MKRMRWRLKAVLVVVLVLIVSALGYFYFLPRVEQQDVKRAIDAYGRSDI